MLKGEQLAAGLHGVGFAVIERVVGVNLVVALVYIFARYECRVAHAVEGFFADLIDITRPKHPRHNLYPKARGKLAHGGGELPVQLLRLSIQSPLVKGLRGRFRQHDEGGAGAGCVFNQRA